MTMVVCQLSSLRSGMGTIICDYLEVVESFSI